jgi:hypothetical protein
MIITSYCSHNVTRLLTTTCVMMLIRLPGKKPSKTNGAYSNSLPLYLKLYNLYQFMHYFLKSFSSTNCIYDLDKWHPIFHNNLIMKYIRFCLQQKVKCKTRPSWKLTYKVRKIPCFKYTLQKPIHSLNLQI